MDLLWAVLVTICTSSVAITGILFVRRRAPDGGCFNDGDRAAGVFGILGTGFAVLLGFVVFLAFTRHDEARAGAEAEALTLIQQFETAQLFPEEHRERLSGQLTCYGRSVVFQEWPVMRAGEGAANINPWGIVLFRTLEGIEPTAASEQSAYDAWLAQTRSREEARRDRTHGAEGVIPASVGRPPLLGRDRLGLHALLRRLRRTGDRTGRADRVRDGGCGDDPPRPQGARQPVPAWRGATSARSLWSARWT